MSLTSPKLSGVDLHLTGDKTSIFAARGDGVHLVRVSDSGVEGGELLLDTDPTHTYATGGETVPSGWVAGVSGQMTGHIIPDTNAAYDLGSAEYKIRHLFLSDNSVTIGDETLSSVNLQNMLELKSVPSSSVSDGRRGDCAMDETHLYLCAGSGKWRRVPLSDW